jgi:hypothetical protein
MWEAALGVGPAEEKRQRRPVMNGRPWEHRGPGVQRAPSPVGSRTVRNVKTPSRSGLVPVSQP